MSETLRFELAGRRKDNEAVFLMSMHRMRGDRMITHRSDYHTVLEIRRKTFNKHFKFNYSNYIYDNLTGITWKEIKEIAHVELWFVGEGISVKQLY